MNRMLLFCFITPLLLFGCVPPSRANTITDWDEKASSSASLPGAVGAREVAIVDVAMFDAVNSIERRYRPYLVQLKADSHTSADAAAASAAATALAALHPKMADDFRKALTNYLAGLSGPADSISAGQRLGEAVAQKVVESRANDGALGPDIYRPRTRPGVYVPTAAMICTTWPTMKPFVLASPSQFRPGPPVSLTSKEWAEDYNEIKDLGSLTSTKRTPEQTETAKFWLMTGPQAYHPLARQTILARHLDLSDSARFMALYAVALVDAYVAVFDAKYHYEFWRPLTAIRNGDSDENPATEPDPTWQPIDSTPMHPEYPCAHCIGSGAAATVIELLAGAQGMVDLTMTSSTAPGVTHHWSSLNEFRTEVANARIWAGFHYRFSTRVGTEMGRQVGRYVVEHAMQPVKASTRAGR